MTKSPRRPELDDLQRGGDAVASEAKYRVSLAKIIEKSPLKLEVFLRIASAMTSELAKLHGENRIHGNLTPAAFDLYEDRGTVILKKLEVHKLSDDAAMDVITRQNIPYQAPERMGLTHRECDCRSDLYSLGIIFFELLCGSLPFSASDELGYFHGHLAKAPTFPPEAAATHPKMLTSIILKLLAKNPAERYQGASGLLYDLEICLSRVNLNGSIPEFRLGTQDISNKLQISRTIYGRQEERVRLLEVFERVRTEGDVYKRQLSFRGRPMKASSLVILLSTLWFSTTAFASVPAPWQLKGDGFIFLMTASDEDSLMDAFIPEALRPTYKNGINLFIYVRYAQTSVGPYHEIIYIPGQFTFPDGSVQPSITRIFVDSVPSLEGGRANWGIPKVLAEFEELRPGQVMVSSDGQKALSFEVKSFGPSIPVSTFLIPESLRSLGQLWENKFFKFALSGKGNVKLASLNALTADSSLFPDLSKRRVLLGVHVENFTAEFPVADITSVASAQP